MSKEGKKLAQMNMAIEIAKAIVDANIKASKLDGLSSSVLLAATESQCEMRSGMLSATPHEYFNRKGRIDKRKVVRYERKRDYKSYLIGERPDMDSPEMADVLNKLTGLSNE
jgi:hypothetical protein